MPIGTVSKFNKFEANILDDASRQWDDAEAGSCMFILADNTYTPLATHATTADLSGVIAAGDGAPINVSNPDIDETTVVGETWLDSDDANFGAAVTITAKYLICIQPVVAGAYDAATSKLMWYVDLDTTSGTAEISVSASEFNISSAVNGWIYFA